MKHLTAEQYERLDRQAARFEMLAVLLGTPEGRDALDRMKHEPGWRDGIPMKIIDITMIVDSFIEGRRFIDGNVHPNNRMGLARPEHAPTVDYPTRPVQPD